MLIGLSGGYCAGKNLAASFLVQEGFAVLDVDKLGHRATEAESGKIVALFGEGILGPDGSIDRKALGRRVFGDKAALERLEAIIHPAANRMAEEWIAARGPEDRICLNAALLHRMPAVRRLDFILEIRAPLLVRVFRAMRRDGLDFGQALSRIRAQRNFGRLLRASGRPVLELRNSGSAEALRASVRRALAAGPGLMESSGR